MQKQHWLPVGSNLRLTITQYSGPVRQQLVARCNDIIHLVANVVNSARSVLFQKFCNRRIVAERFKQFDLRVGQVDENRADTMIGLFFFAETSAPSVSR